MKKVLLFIMLLIMPISVSAKNIIHSIDIDVYINKDGSADIVEVWDVDGDDGTEWYKIIGNMGNMRLSNFNVAMDGFPLQYKSWNPQESLYEKRGFYGTFRAGIDADLELCFGKYDYERHQFTLSYKLTNFILNTDDSQLIYYNFIDKLSDVDFRSFSVTISSYYDFPDFLDVWGYGYKGYAYVSNGKIEMSNKKNSKMNDKYVVLLAKFPLGTFYTSNRIDGYDNFDIVYKMAEKGSYYNNMEYIFILMLLLLGGGIIFFIALSLYRICKKEYGYSGNKKIDFDNIPMYRDIPCNKDIYYANTLIKLNDWYYREGNILGAIILKWVKDNKIGFINEQRGIFNKDTSVIDLTLNPVFDNVKEEKLFKMMYAASKDGYLEAKEFEKWCFWNDFKFLKFFETLENGMISDFKKKGIIYKRRYWKECKYKKVMNDMLYEDSLKLYGLKKYLKEFANMDTKEVMDVKLWDEYLMFAYLFGIADKVVKQLKHMYPDVVKLMYKSNFNFELLDFVVHISDSGISSAHKGRNASRSYSSGGGGFSSGGGGGGSFGGGGGGSR